MQPFQAIGPEISLGILFEAVQKSGLFEDSKTFPDCRPKRPEAEILALYLAEKQLSGFELSQFVHQYFDMPAVFDSGFVSDPSQPLEAHITALWPVLTRKADSTTAPSGSLIALPFPYIVPGGRFGEIYYWDSYFTMLGLKSSGEYALMQNMVDNFAHLLDTVGHIPNGNRTYFLSRSQPPYFSLMVRLLAESNPDSEEKAAVLRRYLPQMEAEYRFWMEGSTLVSEKEPRHRRVVRTKGGEILNRFWDDSPTPRPESYREDLETAEKIPFEQRENTYRHIRAACESGWDFSSRWGADASLSGIRCADILPIDLNCLLWHLEDLLASCYIDFDGEMADFFKKIAKKRKKSIQNLFFDPVLGTFADLDADTLESTGVLSAACCMPLFFGLATPEQAQATCQVLREKLLKPGGIVTTDRPTGQQWDAPNGWAPLQWLAFKAAERTGDSELAAEIRQRWTALVANVYQRTGKMLEKYNVEDISLLAGGGEYPVQDGFGWTNGVTLAFLQSVR